MSYNNTLPMRLKAPPHDEEDEAVYIGIATELGFNGIEVRQYENLPESPPAIAWTLNSVKYSFRGPEHTTILNDYIKFLNKLTPADQIYLANKLRALIYNIDDVAIYIVDTNNTIEPLDAGSMTNRLAVILHDKSKAEAAVYKGAVPVNIWVQFNTLWNLPKESYNKPMGAQTDLFRFVLALKKEIDPPMIVKPTQQPSFWNLLSWKKGGARKSKRSTKSKNKRKHTRRRHSRR